MMLYDFHYLYIAYKSHLGTFWCHDGIQMASMALKVKFDLRFEISSLNYHGFDVHIGPNSFMVGL